MKSLKKIRISLIITIIFLSNNLNSQISIIDSSEEIKIGEVTQVGLPIISCTKVDNIYTFNYINNLNKNNLNHKTFKIIDNDGDFEKLYSLILKKIKEKKNSIVKIKTHEEVIGLEFIKSFGVVGFRFLQYENEETIGYSIALSKRQLNKLFGK